MFFIPGKLISLITFPGVIVHEIAHQLFCRLCRVAVLDVKYFSIGENPSGYVVHEIPRKLSHQVLIGIGPFFVNTIVGALISLSAAQPVLEFGTGSLLDYIFIWLGVSIAMHSFPSTGDAKSILNALNDMEASIIAKIFLYPLVGLIYLCSFGSVVWLDLIYGAGVALIIPTLIIDLLA
jgi:hypothetical protein